MGVNYKWRLLDEKWDPEDEDLGRRIREITRGENFIVHQETWKDEIDWRTVPLGAWILEIHNGKINNLRQHLEFHDDEDDKNRHYKPTQDAITTKLKWPDSDERRKVTINVETYIGMSVGAKHYYVSVEEENNHAWDPDRGRWDSLNSWKYVGATGRRYEKRDCSSEFEAQQYAKHIIGKFFTDPAKYYVVFRSKTFPLGTAHQAGHWND